MNLIILVSFIIFGCYHKELRNTVTYDKEHNLQADIWLPEEKANSYPVVITVHGESWNSGNRASMNSIAKAITRQGFAVVNISYRLTPDSLYPSQIEDVKTLLLYLSENAKVYYLDLTRINFWGYSAGSQIATLAALKLSKSYPIKAIINGAGPMDLNLYPDDPVIKEYLGTDSPAKFREASPINYINQNSPPVFTYHSTNDQVVNFNNAILFHHKLNLYNIPNEIHEVPILGHSMTFLLSKTSVNLAIDFLKKYNFH